MAHTSCCSGRSAILIPACGLGTARSPSDYRTEGEFRALKQCGLSALDILRMLTTAPAERFGVANEKGTITPGKLADLVVLDGDPAYDITAFASIRYTIRQGRVLYTRP